MSWWWLPSLFSGFANADRRGVQYTQPSSSAFEDNPVIGIDSALQVSTVWACVTLLAETIGSLPIQVKREEAGGVLITQSGSFADVIGATPNSVNTSQEFWETLLLNLFLRGNAYARLVRNGQNIVTSLIPMSADQMQVERVEETGEIVYTYVTESREFVYSSDQILHIKLLGNGLVGLSPLDYMRASVGISVKAQQHTMGVYKRSGKRPGILMTGLLNPKTREAIKRNFSDLVHGKDDDLFVLEADFKFEPLGMSPADLQLIETRNFSTQDLARWFRVPAELINAGTSQWGPGLKFLVEGFYKFTIRSHVTRIEQALHRRVLTPAQRSQSLVVKFDLDELLRAAPEERTSVQAQQVQNGIKTRNEIRAQNSNPPVTGGDIVTVQSNLLPIDLLGRVQGGSRVTEDAIAQ